MQRFGIRSKRFKGNSVHDAFMINLGLGVSLLLVSAWVK